MASRLLAVAAALLASPALAQGMLLPTEVALKPLGIRYQRVTAELTDGAAVTRVEQVFVNSGPRQLEAHYVFPLPRGAALQGFYLWINGVKTKGEVLEKQKAQDIYEGIVRRLQDPGLLEYLEGDVFRARVFPVPANGEQRVELVFSQVLEFNAGLYRYRYPLGAASKGAPPLAVRQDFTFTARLASSAPLQSVYSPTHRLAISRQSERAATAGLELGPGTDISRDLDLFYTVSSDAVGFNLLAHRPNPEEPGTFLALVTPRARLQPDEVLPKRVTFVVDTSGSMAGERMQLARKTLAYCLATLTPRDEFNVVRFATDVESLFEVPTLAAPANVARAVRFVEGFEAMGGTAIDEALQRGLADGKGAKGRPHLVVFITDGNPTVGETEEPAIARRAREASAGSRLFTFGVGDELNARLLDRLAAEGRGVSEFLADGRELEVKVSAFFAKVSNPVLADVALDLSAIGAFDVYPRQLGDLFQGNQLVVMGRFRGSTRGVALLKGSVDGARRVTEYPLDTTRAGAALDFVPRLWAIRKVGFLLEEIRLHGEKAELKGEVVALGKRFGIVTPYTSYLVVEDERRAKGEDSPRPLAAAPPAAGAAVSAPGSMDLAEGKAAVAVSRDLKKMKEEATEAPRPEAVRSAAGRWFHWQGQAWVDSEAGTARRVVKVKAFSPAYFALLKARPELGPAMALGPRVVLVLGKGVSVSVSPDDGEERAEPIWELLR